MRKRKPTIRERKKVRWKGLIILMRKKEEKPGTPSGANHGNYPGMGMMIRKEGR